MSKKKEENKVPVEIKKRRFISDAIREVFTSKQKGKPVNIVDAMYSIADSIRGLRDELKKMNVEPDVVETVETAPEEADLSKDV